MTRAEQILAEMPDGICTIQELVKQFDIADSYLRQVLRGLAKDGKMQKVEIRVKGAQGAPRTVGWRKA
jgi:DNA-binding IscR family transcriptional regulator